MKVEIPNKICSHCGSTTWNKVKTYKSLFNKPYKYKCNTCTNRKRREKRIPIPRLPRLNYKVLSDEKTSLKHLYKDILTEEQFKTYIKYRSVHFKRLLERKKRKIAYYKASTQLKGTGFRKLVARSLGIHRTEVTINQEEKYRIYLQTLRQWKKIIKQSQQSQ
jgi:hypothetical protein